ncbi:Mrp protein [Halorhabdus tiamatea SARL4B]|uniref:Iron-sulfur cluster carrier protein n=1 Tax=Halorhabdus tiamatea SARL4B TaxID=1033806 RepID=F7PFD8_9EURY|nr:Mrp/NBP35 family ATP-binding protein [Halorhabdus tiamatea]ERJ06039.1 Mrp protein [Halorhabdus tiamatea SARL4B]CCQ34400.1 plasmid partitioning ATPase-like protein [Halorhabdus tiamatea SARL4B]
MDEAELRELLASVEDPDLEGDIVSLGLVNDVALENGSAHIDLALGAPFSPTETTIADRVREVIGDAAPDLAVELTASIDRDTEGDVLPGVKNVVAVASGKGGVGKSTVAVNLAAGLADRGARVGLFDADIYGPNVPRMLDAHERPEATEDDQIIPPEKHGMKLMSMDFLLGEDDPVIWRGPMVHQTLTQLFEDVQWGDLDYLVVDLPPGTGDTQLTLLQTVPVTGAVIVTTPQGVALDDARKGLEMFGKHETPVLGIIENMSSFKCPDCGSEHAIFGEGGGREFADQVQMPFLGEIPLDPEIRERGDEGRPAVLADDLDVSGAFRNFVANTANNQGIVHRNRLSEQSE